MFEVGDLLIVMLMHRLYNLVLYHGDLVDDQGANLKTSLFALGESDAD